MAPERFWRCVPCDAVVRLTAGDPQSGGDLLGPLWYVAAQQERTTFFETHRTHLVEMLVQATPLVSTTGPLWDPATILRWEVTNGAHRFVIEGGRGLRGVSSAPTLDDPLQYCCVPGQLKVSGIDIGVPAEELARAIDDAIFPHVLPERRLRLLTDAAGQAIGCLQARQLDILYDSPTDPTMCVARLKENGLAHLLTTVGRLLNAWERGRLAAHIRRLHATDELLLTVTRHYDIAPPESADRH